MRPPLPGHGGIKPLIDPSIIDARGTGVVNISLVHRISGAVSVIPYASLGISPNFLCSCAATASATVSPPLVGSAILERS